jgi:hypothetical protein
LLLPFLKMKAAKVRMAVIKKPNICAPFLWLGTMVPRGAIIMHQWSLGVETAACMLHGLVGGSLVESGR